MTPEERKAWEELVELAQKSNDLNVPTEWSRTTLAADAELKRLREDNQVFIIEASDAKYEVSRLREDMAVLERKYPHDVAELRRRAAKEG